MTLADLGLGLRLSQAAGWNQIEADWRRFLALQPDGCFVAEYNGAPVGTTTAFVFGPVAWIAMVLVDDTLRGRGIGTALMEYTLAFVDRQRVDTVRLDATPFGQRLYERLGFVEQFRLIRYEGTPRPVPGVAALESATRADWEALAALDEAVTRTDRRPLLWRLFAEQPKGVRVVRRDGQLVGFVAERPGRRAVQLGPCIADAETGPLLLADAFHRHAGKRVYLDIPTPNQAAARLAETHGLTVQRTLTRMVRGVPVCERVEHLWAGSGPEKG